MNPQPGEHWQDGYGRTHGPLEFTDGMERPFHAAGGDWRLDGQFYTSGGPDKADLTRRVYVSDTPPASVDRAISITLDPHAQVAAMAMQGLLAHGYISPSSCAVRSIEYADHLRDALLAALSKPVAP